MSNAPNMVTNDPKTAGCGQVCAEMAPKWEKKWPKMTWTCPIMARFWKNRIKVNGNPTNYNTSIFWPTLDIPLTKKPDQHIPSDSKVSEGGYALNAPPNCPEICGVWYECAENMVFVQQQKMCTMQFLAGLLFVCSFICNMIWIEEHSANNTKKQPMCRCFPLQHLQKKRTTHFPDKNRPTLIVSAGASGRSLCSRQTISVGRFCENLFCLGLHACLEFHSTWTDFVWTEILPKDVIIGPKMCAGSWLN